MITSDARPTASAGDMVPELRVRRVTGLLAQLSDVSTTIDALLSSAVRNGGQEAVALHEASQAVHRAMLALAPPEAQR